MEGGQEMQEIYSSTSSDDQSSINSVIRVGGSGMDTSESDNSAPNTPLRTPNRMLSDECESYDCEEEDDNDLNCNNTGDLSTTDSEDDVEERLRLEGHGDSDDSTSSEETQIWVPVRPPKASPKPLGSTSYRHSAPLLPPMAVAPSSSAAARHSIISHNSATGRAETLLLSDAEHPNGTDSGYSNESPENQVDHYARNLPTPPPDPPGHQSTPRNASPPSVAASSSGSSRSSRRVRSIVHPDSLLPLPAVALTQYHTPSQNGHVNGHSPYLNGEREPLTSVDDEDVEMAARLSKHENRDAALESLFNILSSLYAMIVIVFGLCLPVADIFSTKLEAFIFEGFYIYLHTMSVLFLLYVYCYILRRRKNPSKKLCRKRSNISRSEEAPKPLHQRFSLSCTSHTGSFYLRLGAIGFGVGAMIHEGLMLGAILEYKRLLECTHVLTIVRPVVQLTFTFFQLYFIFLNSRMCIHKYRTLARFGLMHMVATNICVWLRVIIQETVHDIERSSQGLNEGHINDVNVTAGNETACQKHQIMGEVVENASPYLYPCTIEYSLIAAAILYCMWLNIGKPPPPPSTPDTPGSAHLKKHLRMSVDCAGANRGLFFGIFTLVATIISLIAFFVLVEQPHLKEAAVKVVHMSELTLYCLALVAVIVASIKIRHLKFDSDYKDELDGILILISLMGVYMYSIFSIVAGRYGDNVVSGAFTMATNALIMLQATVQTVFILNGLRRSPRNCFHERKKPGREFVTFLLVCNIGMWGINTFEVLRADSNPLALNFYGFLQWSIISHVATPLAIFYRFHSTVCLSAIWKNAYKMKVT